MSKGAAPATIEPHQDLAAYSDALLDAVRLQAPVFASQAYGDKYRDCAIDPDWFAASFVQNAAVEADGARKLWALAGATADDAVRDKIRRHARDEARHARIYISLLQRIFPDALRPDDRRSVLDSFPRYSVDATPEFVGWRAPEDILDDLVQMNIGEIRTRINQLLMRPVVVAYGAGEERWLLPMLDSLMRDETHHIRYTAEILDSALNDDGEHVRDRIALRLSQFNEITLDEVDGLVFEGS